MQKRNFDNAIETRIFGLVAACFALSGFAALLYQTAWLRQLSLIFGTSELAVVAVLAAYMGGLAVGSAIAGRLIAHIQRPIAVYGLLEAGIAGTALAVPALLGTAQGLYVTLFTVETGFPNVSSAESSVFYLVSSFFVLLMPTALMGATLPLLMKYVVTRSEQIGPRSAVLYAINTLGAVFGTLFAAFILLPEVGLNGTIWVGIALNVSVFFMALLAHRIAINRRTITEAATSSFRSAEQSKNIQGETHIATEQGRASNWILPIIAASGVTSFAYEVLWTRLLGHVLGGSIYAFSTMLASFLIGIALGSAIASRLCMSMAQAVTGMIVAQLGIAVTSLLVYVTIDSIVPSQFNLVSDATFAIAALTPAACFIGATFPFAVRIATLQPTAAGEQSARVYAWNTTGAIIGAIGAGYIVIPLLGYSGSVKALVLVNASLALFCSLILSNKKPTHVVLSGTALLAIFIFFEPRRPDTLINASRLDPSSHRDFKSQEKELFYAVGHSATVLLKEKNGDFILKTNGLPEALISPEGRLPQLHPQHWLTLLPSLARPGAESMLVVGFGGGVALEAIAPQIKQVDVIELETEVIAANTAIRDLRDIDPLDDPRLDVIVGDARGLMSLTGNKYEIIVSQPSHPWTAGASNLYTSEFVALAKKRLTQDGVFLQWINWNFLDEELLRSMAATLQASFVNVRIYQHSESVLHFIASDGPLNIESSLAKIDFSSDERMKFYEQFGALSLEDIAYALTLDEDGTSALAGSADLNSDNFNRLAFLSANAVRHNTPKVSSDKRLLDVIAPYLVYNDDTSILMKADDSTISRTRVAEKMLNLGFLEQVSLLAKATQDDVQRLTIRAFMHRQRGEYEEMYNTLWEAYEIAPHNETVQFALIRDQLGSVARNQAEPRVQKLANEADGIIRAIIDGWRYASLGRWSYIAVLEEQLSTAQPRDIWFQQASQLRAQWRLQSTSLNWLRPRDKEALEITNRALAVGYNFDLMLVRLATSAKLKDRDSVLVSANRVADHIESKLDAAREGDYRFNVTVLQNHLRQIEYIDNLVSKESLGQKHTFNEKALNAKLESLRRHLSDLSQSEGFNNS